MSEEEHDCLGFSLTMSSRTLHGPATILHQHLLIMPSFTNSLGNDYLLRIEEMGVNLHMLQLRQDLFGKM